MRSWLAIGIIVAITGQVRGADREPAELKGMTLRAADGKTIPLVAPAKGVLVVVVYSTECPISNAYSPELSRIARDFPAAHLRMIGVCVDPDTSDATIQTHHDEYRLGFPVSRDQVAMVTKKIGAKFSPEVAVIDDKDHLVYRGRINDQYAARGVRRQRVTENNLRDAITAVLAGQVVAKPRVEAVGCPLPELP